MRAEEILDRADRTACEMFAETGGLPEARAWIYTTGQVTSIPFKPKNLQAEMRLKAMACAFILASRKAGLFEGAVTVAEAWMAMGRTRQPLLPPSKDPDRIEVVILLAYGDDGRATGRARRIISHEGRRRLGEPVSCFQQAGMHYESWLDDAFKGYTTH
jgi:hypothetical protein